MSTYFTNFPTVNYNGVNSRDITRRTNFVSSVLSSPYLFLPYTVKEGEKPEDIAYNYYGTIEATWLVLMANNIVDPYNQWALTYEHFAEYLITKYASLSGRTGYDVIAWLQDETILENIVYYYRKTTNGVELKVSPDTFPYVYDIQNQIVGRDVAEGWTALRLYEYEYAANESRREVIVVDRRYYEQINEEFKRIIKQ